MVDILVFSRDPFTGNNCEGNKLLYRSFFVYVSSVIFYLLRDTVSSDAYPQYRRNSRIKYQTMVHLLIWKNDFQTICQFISSAMTNLLIKEVNHKRKLYNEIFGHILDILTFLLDTILFCRNSLLAIYSYCIYFVCLITCLFTVTARIQTSWADELPFISCG